GQDPGRLGGVAKIPGRRRVAGSTVADDEMTGTVHGIGTGTRTGSGIDTETASGPVTQTDAPPNAAALAPPAPRHQSASPLPNPTATGKSIPVPLAAPRHPARPSPSNANQASIPKPAIPKNPPLTSPPP